MSSRCSLAHLGPFLKFNCWSWTANTVVSGCHHIARIVLSEGRASVSAGLFYFYCQKSKHLENCPNVPCSPCFHLPTDWLTPTSGLSCFAKCIALLISLALSICFNRIDSKHSVLDFVNNIFKVIIVYYAVTPFLSRALNFSHIIEKYVNYVDMLSFSPRKQELSRTSTSPIKLW